MLACEEEAEGMLYLKMAQVDLLGGSVLYELSEVERDPQRSTIVSFSTRRDEYVDVSVQWIPKITPWAQETCPLSSKQTAKLMQ